MKRRDFIKVVGVSSVALALSWPFTEVQAQDKTAVAHTFPQSVASGDPTPNSVIIWTRVAATGPGRTTANTALQVFYQVATSSDFSTVIAQGNYTTSADFDNTVRVKLTGLQPYTNYYYRFSYNGVSSRTGRTKTAPQPGDPVQVKFGYISCQDYTNGYYAALGALAQENLDFVMHVGDYIYETVGAGFQGSQRSITLPDGGTGPNGEKFALTLADYRTLYRTYRSDPQLQAVHEAFPMVAIWDDHEYSNDCWGATATYFNETQNEFNPARRKASQQAWYENMIADIPAYNNGLPWETALKIYRTFRFGSLLELILTDERLYRSDHLIPESHPAPPFSGNSEYGSRYLVLKSYFDKAEESRPAISMLGATQKDWFKNKLQTSTATWKLWGNEVSLLRLQLGLGTPDTTFYVDCDQWDGYNRERAELMRFIGSRRIKNVVALTGDIHTFFVGHVYENFDYWWLTRPTMVDFVVGSVTSATLTELFTNMASVAKSPLSGIPNLKTALSERNFSLIDELIKLNNPWIKHARTSPHGYAVVTARPDKLVVEMKEVAGVDTPDRPVNQVYRFAVPVNITNIVREA